MSRLNDITLATQVAVFHNRRAFDQLVREYQSPVRRFFLAQSLGDEMLSDDLAQETFLKAYTHIGQYRGTSGFLTWLTRIAYNVWYDYCRSEKSKMTREQCSSDDPCVQGKAAANSTLYTQHSTLNIDLQRALAVLKEEERTCITLQLIDGYDIKDIARITQMKEGTVKSHLSRGKEKMANYLRQNGYDR